MAASPCCGERPQRVQVGGRAPCGDAPSGRRIRGRDEASSGGQAPQDGVGSTDASRRGKSCMTGPVFVDTNVIVYRYDTKDPKKQVRADDWHTLVWNTRSGRLSFQVLQESYATLTRKLKPAMAGADAPTDCPQSRRVATGHDRPRDLRARLDSPGAPFPFLVGCAHRRDRADVPVQSPPNRGPAARPGIPARFG